MTCQEIGKLFKQYELYLVRYIEKHLYNGCPKDIIYDCLHDVFLIALEKKEDPKFNYNPAAWLTKTAQYVIDNYNRKQLNRLRFHQTDYDLTRIPDSRDWFEEIAYRIAIENNIWKKIMEELHPNDRNLLIMRYYEELSLDEIASFMGISKNLLKVRLSRMKAHTKTLIKKYMK